MPKLDGISATSMIRQFDHMTPIISMTSNSKPNEIMTYYSSGALRVMFTAWTLYKCFFLGGDRYERYITQTIHAGWSA